MTTQASDSGAHQGLSLLGNPEPNVVFAHGTIIDLNRNQKISETDRFTQHRYRQFTRRLTHHVRDILDVGCNTGRGGSVIKAMVPDVRITGLDCVPDRIAALDPRVYSSSICTFAHAIPLADESYDAIVAGEFVEHLPPDLVFATLCEFFRVLRLRGLLLLTTPNPGYFRNKLRRQSVLGGAHLSQHHIRNLRRRLQDVGFSGVRIRGSGGVSIILGERFPFMNAYGSYLAEATKW
jgi:ubiquinone/menaquinone biosynthesis C-methylase UbiE